MKDNLLDSHFVVLGSCNTYLKAIRSPFLRIPLGVCDWSWKEIKLAFNPFGVNKKVDDLEGKICDIFGVKYCLTLPSGRVALKVAIQSLGLKQGDSIILPSFLCLSVLDAVIQAGCKPRFVDIDENLNIDPDRVLEAIDKDTKAILVPHLFGKAADILKLVDIAKKNNLYLIDDSAQSLGIKIEEKYLGTFGDVGIFSFGMFKPLIGIGGGALLTDDPVVYRRAKLMCNMEESGKGEHIKALKILIKSKFRKFSFPLFLLVRYIKNLKSRSGKPDNFHQEGSFTSANMSKLKSLFVLSQLENIDRNLEKRVILGTIMFNELLKLKFIKPGFSDVKNHGFLKFVIKVESEDFRVTDKLLYFLLKRGIESEPAYIPLHLRINHHVFLNRTENIYSRLLCLPINPSMNEKDVLFIVRALRDFENRYF